MNEAAMALVTDKIRKLFETEISDRSHDGISPATLSSVIDSMWPADGTLDEGWDRTDYIAMLTLVALVGGDTMLCALL